MFSREPIGEPIYKTLQIPLHIGVPCFVMISGYFGIHFSFKGLFRLLGMAYTYSFLLEIVDIIITHQSWHDAISGLLIIGNNKLWFLTTYLWLYLMSPIINKFLSDITKGQRLYIFVSLAFINIYAGHMMQHDPSLVEGKNILNFTLLYIIGNTIRTYQKRINTVKSWVFPCLFLFSAFGATTIGILCPSYQLPYVGNIWYKFFAYDSPGIYINATLVFLWFSQMSFSSSVVNYISSSVFSMYLLCFNAVGDKLYNIPCQYSELYNNDILKTLMMTLVLAIAYMIFCVAIDKSLTPVWQCYRNLGEKLDRKYKLF